MFSKSKMLILAYGVGGHKEQMRRFFSNLEVNFEDVYISAFTDDSKSFDFIDDLVNIQELRSKTNRMKFFNLHSVFDMLKRFFLYKKKFENISLISTGPGHTVIIACLVRCFGGRVVHIETWSRFYTKSLTGRLMYVIANKFYVQNEELLEIYPKAIYSGRL